VSAGRVVLVNGAPSSGKTTIARALWPVLEPPHWYRSLDEFRKGYTEEAWDRGRGPWSAQTRPMFLMLLAGYLGSLRAMALAGHHILSESVILPANLGLYRSAFEGLEVFVAGVRCPLRVAEERERARAPSERHLGVPIDLNVPEFELVHAQGRYDVEVDTSLLTLDEAVARIRVALARSSPRTFAEWSASAAT